MARAADVIRHHLASRLASIRLGIADPDADELPSPLDIERLVAEEMDLVESAYATDLTAGAA
ncbi:MAG: hypothetical protein C4523_08790 [Myxococcales bacterium]|nr:MAG: hypothetical protein C4523_08790 [Myxococcales bacterium]